MEKTEKLSPREWLENLWYHYKWLIIFGGLLLILIVVSCVQIFSKDEPDVDILHVGPMTINPVVGEAIESTIGGLASDYNDDGEVMVNILDITVNKFGTAEEQAINYDYNNNALKRFQTEIRAGDAVIYLLDEEYFNICMEEGLLTPFDEIVDDADMPENVIEGCGVKLSQLDAYSLEGLKDIPEGAILCLRRSPEKDEIAYGRTMETWNGNRKTFLNILKYKKN
jgi:hypothetical protein